MSRPFFDARLAQRLHRGCQHCGQREVSQLLSSEAAYPGAIRVTRPPAQGCNEWAIGRQISFEQPHVLASFAGKRSGLAESALVYDGGCEPVVLPWEDCVHSGGTRGTPGPEPEFEFVG